VFIGPSDLGADLGYPGRPDHPDVVAAVGDAIARVTGAGKAAGVLAGNLDIAATYRERGARFIAVGADTGLLVRATDELRAAAERLHVGRRS
jgi:4-hydroxy-2-oxoheptanedioate aldolase